MIVFEAFFGLTGTPFARDKEETMAYIAKHLAAARAPGEIYTQAALAVIYGYSLLGFNTPPLAAKEGKKN